MKSRRLISGCLAMTVIGLFAELAIADTEPLNPMLNDKYGIWIGGFFPKVNSEIRINGEIVDDNPILNLERHRLIVLL